MKKFIKTFILAMCLILPCLFCLTACDNKSCEHTFGEWMISTNATCIVDGEQYRECTECGHKETQSIPATGHAFGGYIIDEIPTTQNSGEYHRECATCHEIDRVTVSALKSTGLEFELNEDKQSYSVTGIGSCTDTYINIPNTHNGLPVTKVGYWAFDGNTSIVGVTLSDYTVEIDDCGFGNCSNLKTIKFPNCLEIVREFAFSGSAVEYTNYEDIDYLGNETNPYYICIGTTERNNVNPKVHNDTKIIYPRAFSSVYYIESLTFSSNVKYVGEDLFNMSTMDATPVLNMYFNGTLNDWININFNDAKDCVYKAGYNLYFNGQLVTEITVSGSQTSLRNWMFAYCKSIKKVKIEEGVEKIGQRCFQGCKIEEIILPESLKEIGTGAFLYNNFEEITLSKNTTKVALMAFESCSSLEKITFYNTLEKINDIIYGCSALTEIHFIGTIDEFQALDKDGQWNANCGDFTIYCTDGTIAKDGTVTRN